MTQWLQMLAFLPEALNSVLNTQIRQLTAAYNSSSKEFGVHAHSNTYTLENKP